ncbi:MAG: hypothetical protein HC853_19200 [Anaerolineae bacterium]|nr:hypothetical protein [Anaerolineae bacterium]
MADEIFVMSQLKSVVQTKVARGQTHTLSSKGKPGSHQRAKKRVNPVDKCEAIGSLATLSATLAQCHASWVTRQSAISQLGRAEKQALVDMPASRPTPLANHDDYRTGASNHAAMVDWRNYRGGNHIAPARQHIWPNTSAAYAVIALMESMISIERGKSMRLSVDDLYSDKESYWPDQLLAKAKRYGVVDDASFLTHSALPVSSSFPNIAHLQAHDFITGRDIRSVRFTTQHELLDITDRKHHLTHIGPCVGVLQVFHDFFSYGDRVYQRVSDDLIGLQCVVVIGYSDFEQCWFCQNSWGAGWGQGSYFKIAYGQCQIDTTFPFWGASGVQLPTDCVIGDLRSKYLALEGEQGSLGYPITCEIKTQDELGRLNHFQGGSIFWTPSTGAHVIHGVPREKWASMGWERSLLGYLITDVLTAPDGEGQLCHFEYGSIYSSNTTGACAIHGPIREKWAAMGWERGSLGYPVSDVLPTVIDIQKAK